MAKRLTEKEEPEISKTSEMLFPTLLNHTLEINT
jgi:hypothetical protein